MKSYWISQLAREFNLSRSTLLYYHRIGLLPPSGRSEAGYRIYCADDREKLQRICDYRDAGLSLEEIGTILKAAPGAHQEILEVRLREQAAQIRDLQEKQRTLSSLLKTISSTSLPAAMDKATWVKILRASGMDDSDMRRWHAEFEKRAPQAHHEFLLSLGISEKESLLIRKWSKDLEESGQKKMQYFYQLYENIPRQGPGSDSATRQAIALLPPLPKNPRTLDIGCGCGRQTLELAKQLGGELIAVDNHAAFLKQLEQDAQAAGLSQVIHPQLGSMYELPFAAESFDLLWAEGAIYIIGFERGLKEWRPLLKPEGLLVCSELCWLTPERPAEAVSFWEVNYPDMQEIATTQNRAEQSGYQLLDSFVLPPDGWEDNYYRPLESAMVKLRQAEPDNSEVEATCAEIEREIELYRKYGESFGYVYYLLQKS